jgi:hypothetical protein
VAEDERSPQAKAYHWASRVITVSLEMVLPASLGYYLDGKIGTRFVLTIVGCAAGLSLGMWHLLKMVSENQGSHGS